MEAIELVKLTAAVALPFILYILHGIRKNLHDLRDTLQPLVSKVAVIEALHEERKGLLDVLQKALVR